MLGTARASASCGEIVPCGPERWNVILRRTPAFLRCHAVKSVSDLTWRDRAVIIKCVVGPALRYRQDESMAGPGPVCCQNGAAVERHIGKGDMMRSVMAVENGKERCKGFSLCLFTFAVGLYLCALLLAGCSTRQPGLTAAEVRRDHKRTMSLNTQMMMSDIDKFLLLDKPSMLTDRRIP
jgi:hypothetical protein